MRGLGSLAVAALAMLAGVFALAPARADPTGAQIGGRVLVEPIKAISTTDLWELTGATLVSSKRGNAPGGQLVYWLYDYEDAPRDGGWVAVGIVGIAFGDLGDEPVMIRLWAKSDHEIMGPKLAVQERAAKPDEAAAFEVTFRGQGFLMTMKPDGVVMIDGAEVGHVKS